MPNLFELIKKDKYLPEDYDTHMEKSEESFAKSVGTLLKETLFIPV